jgi:hypothetical protein
MNGARRRLAAALVGAFVALLSGTATGQDVPEPRVRARADVDGPVTVGQPVDIVVEVLVPSYFTGAPQFPDFDIDDALTLFVPRGTNFTEREGRTTWAGQRRSYTVYPQRAGTYEVAGIAVDVGYFVAGRGRITSRVSSDPVEFTAQVPAEAEGLGYFIAATGLTVEQALDPPPETLRVGDAFTRRVTVSVEGALAMVIPPLGLDAPAGLAAYPEPPVVTDEGGERGAAISGRRVETITYVAREVGAYKLSPVELAWWDVEAGALRRETLPELAFDVLPAQAQVEFALTAEEESGDADSEHTTERVSVAATLRRWAVPLGVLLVGALGLRRLARTRGLDPHQVQTWWLSRDQTEGAHFRRFRQAARSGDPRATVRTLAAWLDRRHIGPGAATFQALAKDAADPKLDREATALDAAVFVADPTPDRWSGSRLADRVGHARRHRPTTRGTDSDDLAPLNPRA